MSGEAVIVKRPLRLHEAMFGAEILRQAVEQLKAAGRLDSEVGRDLVGLLARYLQCREAYFVASGGTGAAR